MLSHAGASLVVLGPGPRALQQSHRLLPQLGASPARDVCIAVSMDLEDAVGG
jgi:hypothetical protein